MEKDIKSSVRLPKTNFEMKANLKNLDEEVLQSWEKNNIYQSYTMGHLMQMVISI